MTLSRTSHAARPALLDPRSASSTFRRASRATRVMNDEAVTCFAGPSGRARRNRWHARCRRASSSPSVQRLQPRRSPPIQHVYLTRPRRSGCATATGDAPTRAPHARCARRRARPHGTGRASPRRRHRQHRGRRAARRDACSPSTRTSSHTPAPGEIYAYQLDGLEVSTCDGQRLGTVAPRPSTTGATKCSSSATAERST